MSIFIKAGSWIEKRLGYKCDFNLTKYVTDLVATIPTPGGSGIVTITKAEIDILISTDSLVIGTTYKISGVHPALYDDGTTSGTTIYLQALTVNTLAKEGHGEFYNPKYNQAIDGFGVWSNRSTWTATLTSLIDFNANELITANNGATGQLFTSLSANIFIALTGNWAAATSITGDSSEATATIATVVLKTYAIGNKAIWGGYSWTNVNGLVGEKIDILNLDAEWTKDVYDLTNYNKVIDIIEYDYTTNWISRRYEIEADNDVIFTKEDNTFFINDYGLNSSAISVFMFGNGYNYGLFKGLKNNKVENSYFECVDFCGSNIYFNTLTNNSNIYSNTLTNNSYIYSNTLTNNSNIYSNTLTGSSVYFNILTNYNNIYYNTLTDSSISFNILTDSSSIDYNILTIGGIDYNTLTNSSGIYSNTLTSGSFINSNTLTNNSNFNYNTLTNSSSIYYNTLTNSSDINSNILTSSNINSNTLINNSNFNYNTLTNSSIYSNTLIDSSSINSNTLTSSFINSNTLTDSNVLIGLTYPLVSKNLQYNTMEKTTIGIDITAGTILFSTYPKTVYSRPDGTAKIRYYNDSDVLVIANITD